MEGPNGKFSRYHQCLLCAVGFNLGVIHSASNCSLIGYLDRQERMLLMKSLAEAQSKQLENLMRDSNKPVDGNESQNGTESPNTSNDMVEDEFHKELYPDTE